jgi:cation diffusion facilitator CzcD-associated flavoprotein CzcO
LGTVPGASDIVIVGAGFAGLGLAIRFQQAGISDFAILEKEDAIGGTWHKNDYPGCACDVPSHLYSYSFARNPDWSRAYGDREEILAYLRSTVDEHGVERHVRFGTEVLGAEWDDEAGRWRIETSKGPLTARVLITAMGPFDDPKMPDIPGRERFAGTAFHSAHWDHDHDLSGERVAVIGTGASAVQFIPRIQKQAGRLLVFQRTPPWVMPRMDRRTSERERALLRRFPFVQDAIRGAMYSTIEGLGVAIFVDQRFTKPYELMGRLQLRRQVKDPVLRAKLTPDYRLGCKRAVLADAYYPALAKPNVDVIPEAVSEIRERSVVDGTGREHEVDTLIYGTGYYLPTRDIARFRGRDGRSLYDLYEERPQSYLGTTFAGFPNLFVFLGPFAAGGNQSALYMLESQMNYIVSAVQTMRREGLERVEVRPEMHDAFTDRVHERSAETVWLNGGCKSYYTNAKGENAGLWPSWSFAYRRRTKRFDRDAYRVKAAA